VSRETSELMHYVSLLLAGFNLDYNDFSLLEQKHISYGLNRLKAKNKEKEAEMYLKFFKKGFESVCKTIAKKGI